MGVQSSAKRDKQGRQTDKLVKGYARPAWRGSVQAGKAKRQLVYLDGKPPGKGKEEGSSGDGGGGSGALRNGQNGGVTPNDTDS